MVQEGQNETKELYGGVLEEIKSGKHPQFIYNEKEESVVCRCGHSAPFLGGGYVCGTITAHPCEYCKSSSKVTQQKIVMEVDVYKPFADLAQEENTWMWLEDYSEDNEYWELDCILRYLNGDINIDELPDTLHSLNGKELRDEYSRRFPVMFGKALQKIGRDLEAGNVIMKLTGLE